MSGLVRTTNQNQMIRIWIGIKMTTCHHSFVVDTSFQFSGFCRRCGKAKTFAGDWVKTEWWKNERVIVK